MPAKGEVRVCVTASDAGQAARWLRRVYLPALASMGDTVLTTGHNDDTICLLGDLAAILLRASVRKRSGGASFKINLHRQMVKRFAAVGDWPEPPTIAAVDRLLHAMKEAASSRRGRPALSPALRAARTGKCVTIDERFRKRLARRERADAAWSAWFSEVRTRGETILTSALPSPKI
jgi:hypothetical protein